MNNHPHQPKAFLVVFAVLGFCLPCHADSDFLTPGIGIGNVALGMDRAGVHQRLSRPNDTTPEGSVDYYKIGKDHDRHSLEVLYDRKSRVQTLQTDSPDFQTRRGVSCNSTLRQILSLYPHMRHQRFEAVGDGFCEYYDSVQNGIGFCFFHEIDFVNHKDVLKKITGREHPMDIVIHRRGAFTKPYISSY